ncbi:hypothetical protein RFI_17735 [Reticulomyxa filosa]|uniref:Calcineurin-like phosphoesterase domain-containing protein n=1 Tax=Reticulomyxa filosa TaxID=46433 RepID=X6MZP2_RETFI|nr:hypothetical protein RFI_17735 [Reticulomyxa filosa]|eukprot:ETO19495.1 hypothetical protein RFI_17735 [Reticulomyxa filosa]
MGEKKMYYNIYGSTGIKIYGSPWQPEFCDWAFNLRTRKELASKWAQIPLDTDILITHGPPFGHGDVVSDGWKNNAVGCKDLLERVMAVKPKFHVFGHIHEGYGVTTTKLLSPTVFVNASTVTVSYRVENKPILFFIKKSNTKQTLTSK